MKSGDWTKGLTIYVAFFLFPSSGSLILGPGYRLLWFPFPGASSPALVETILAQGCTLAYSLQASQPLPVSYTISSIALTFFAQQ